MITVDASKLQEVEEKLGEYRKWAPLVLSRALNRAAASAKTSASKKVRESYTLKASDVNATFTVKRANPSSLSATVTSKSGAIGLDKFKISPKEPRHSNPPKGGLKVTVKKDGGAKRILTAFVASVNGNKAFLREGGKRVQRPDGRWTELPIKRLFGPPVPEMLDRKSIREFVEEEAAKVFDQRVEHEIKNVMEGR
jgi:hypothetical protein